MEAPALAATFVQIVEAGSFSKLARGASRSRHQPPDDRLEQELGAKLLVRTARSLQLTEESADEDQGLRALEEA